jgi:poly-gamma-glutamate capsule biosynthesis protein CapA/YwtB (metallophosphatase superfamily)
LSVRTHVLTVVLVFVSIGALYGQVAGSEKRTTIQAFGDVNLGRAVGQELLKGNTNYPFRYVRDSLAKAEIVFVNLESQLTQQGGETQHPKYNVIFCGPPVGASSLKGANVSVVSTANNHAYDYGRRALQETILNLDSAGIISVGTSIDSVETCAPVIMQRSGIRIGFLAYTQFMNFKGNWIGHVSLFDEHRVARDIASLRSKVDFVLVSYHGGNEYVDRPPASVKRDFRIIADAGADVVLGHHPHYVQGIEWYKKTLLLYSLGNFVFYQPQLEWTQMGLGVELGLSRRDSTVVIDRAQLMPIRAGLQPTFVLSSAEEHSFFERLRRLSPAKVYQNNGEWFVEVKKDNE